MKRFSVGFECVALSVAAALMLAGPVFAQGARLSGGTGPVPAAGGAADRQDKVEIKRFPQPNKTSMVRTPDFNPNVSGLQSKTSKRPREWAVFEIKYTTGAKWTDELAFTYHVMAKGKDETGADSYSYYTLTVRYIDISKGDHMSCVALPPSLVERYGDPVSLGLEIVGRDGTVLASQVESTERYPPTTKEGKWWLDTNVMDNQKTQVKRRQGLLDRSKTPFALINPDDYEVVQ